MAWLHDNGDENEYSQFEEDEGGEKESVLEETEEEVTITERPGMPEATPSVPKPKPRRPSAARTRRKPARAKARTKKKAGAKRGSRKSSARKRSRSRKKR